MLVWNFLSIAAAIYIILKVVRGSFRPRFPSDELITGGQPRAKDIEQLRQQGCTAVVNMRGAHERTGFDEKAYVESLGMTYHHIPVMGPGDVNDATVKALHKVLKKAKGKTLIHCASGNRVGAAVALYGYKHQNMSMDDALSFGRRAGLGAMAPSVRAQMK
ncbi:MAG: protein tyrosine phosphatase family protein [Sphingomonadales bacterium]|nr:protein tyrosine phosphatase family protein [Sphingomonadales bacterium]